MSVWIILKTMSWGVSMQEKGEAKHSQERREGNRRGETKVESESWGTMTFGEILEN